MEAEIVIASSPTDAGISCWNLETGDELCRFKSCSSPPHGLVCVAGRFLASSQVRDSKRSSSGSIFYWFWNKPNVQVNSSPAEQQNPLGHLSHIVRELILSEEAFQAISTYGSDWVMKGNSIFTITDAPDVGTRTYWLYLYIEHILLDVETGKLLKKWHAHYRAVTCLVFNDDQSLLISGAEDGCVRVWSLFSIFNDEKREEVGSLHGYSFHEHSLKVTDIKIGHGGCNAIIVSASEDRTCKLWGLSERKLLKNIVFPSIIDAIVLEPGEKVFYAGGRDGEIYIAGSCDARSLELCNHSKGCKAVTSLASSADGFRLVAGLEDGMIRVWNIGTWDSCVFRHTKGSVNNVLVIRQTQFIFSQTPKKSMASSLERCSLLLPPDPRPLKKYANSPDENDEVKVYLGPHNDSDQFLDSNYISVQTMENHIKELERLGSSAAAEVELERPKNEQQYFQMSQRWESLCKQILQFCVEEILDGSLTEGASSPEQCSKKRKKRGLSAKREKRGQPKREKA